jgi:hypothetical protein
MSIYYKKIFKSVLDDIIKFERRDYLQFYICNEDIQNLEYVADNVISKFKLDNTSFKFDYLTLELHQIDLMIAIYKFYITLDY